MKLTKNRIVLMSIIAGILVITMVVAIMQAGGKTPPPEDSPVIGEPSPGISLPSPDAVLQSPAIASPEPTISPTDGGDGGLVIDVGGSPEPTDSNDTGTSTPVRQPEQPVPTPKPPQPTDNGGGIIIGDDNPKPTPYSCGVPNHKCNNPEMHAFITNLEIQGCTICTSKSCPSFYGTDQWGNGGLFPHLCPKYDIKKDPLYYCQDCGKKTGDGKNGTCAMFVIPINCPMCNKHVPSWTCHTCD
jgi:hypothetical protein